MSSQSDSSLRASDAPAMRDGDRRIALAVQDVKDGARAWELWVTLGLADIKHRYRRSVIGPLWITLSMGLLITALGLIYGAIFNLTLNSYLPYLTIGIAFWMFFSTTTLEICTAFTSSEGIIKQCPLPFSTYIYRTIWRNLIVLAHNFVVVLLILGLTGVLFSANIVLFILGMALFLSAMLICAFPLATLCTRFRDVPQILASALQLVFFVTPILFQAEKLPAQLRGVADFNPIYHLIEVVRVPLTGGVPSLGNYLGVLAVIALGSVASVALFARFRSRIAYWL